MAKIIRMDTDTWNAATHPTQTGSSGSNDLVNDVTTTINSLLNALNGVAFIENTRNLITVMEDFGNGLNAALACVSLDLQVVASGLGAAAAAFAATDTALANMFANLDTQLGYYTNTASSVTLATPSASAQASLISLGSTPSSTSFWDTTPGHVLEGAGVVVVVVVVVAAVIILAPVEVVAAAGTAVVAAGAAFLSWAGGLAFG
ncbi:MAG: hypothetical protein ABI234_14745 [Ktedonobacteraceae bacterium]